MKQKDRGEENRFSAMTHSPQKKKKRKRGGISRISPLHLPGKGKEKPSVFEGGEGKREKKMQGTRLLEKGGGKETKGAIPSQLGEKGGGKKKTHSFPCAGTYRNK